MIAKIYSAIPYGYNGKIVEVEGDTNRGLPAFNIVGMANKTVSESRERVRSALSNSGLEFPAKRVTINLAPADLAKDGVHLDLPIALAILILAKQLRPEIMQDKLFVGELSLDGQTKPVHGIINIVEAARDAGFTTVFVPAANLIQAQLISGINTIGVSSLTQLFLHLKGVTTIVNSPTSTETTLSSPQNTLLEDIQGQNFAKRALEIAIAGRHNLLLSGPPGTGKTMLAEAALSLLPPPSSSEQIEITKIHSLTNSNDEVLYRRPFRAPHHSASSPAIIGGGTPIKPGEISLAHHGILFLDELPEYSRDVLEALRQPLESGQVHVSRAREQTSFPANFILIATMNPCPCGYSGDPDHECTCTPLQINNYQKRVSGPILDRIDLNVLVERVSTQNLLNSTTSINTTTETVYKNIIQATKQQADRYHATNFYNSDLNTRQIKELLNITSGAKKLLDSAGEKLKLSARSYFKVIKVAQTIADLAGSSEIVDEYIAEALTFRKREQL